MSRNGMVPDGWRSVRLGDVAVITMGQAPPGSSVNEDGEGLPFIQGNAEFGVVHPRPKKWCAEPWRRALAGDVLMSVRAPVGALNIADTELGIGRGVGAVRFEKLDPRFGWYAIQHGVKQLNRVSQGSTFEAVGRSEVADLLIPYPPLPEQRKIAEMLSSVDEAIKRTEAVIERVQEVKRALAQELLTRGMPGWHTRFTQTEVGEIPEDWEVVRLGDLLAEPIRNGFSSTAPDSPTGRWVLTLGAVTHAGFDPAQAKPAPCDDASVEAARLRDGDLLVSRSNTRERVGLAGIYSGDPAWCAYPDLLMRLRLDHSRISTRFAEALLLSPRGRAYFAREARGTSGSMVKIERTILSRFPLVLPGIEEQAAILDAVQSASSPAEAEVRRLGELRSVKAALSGELLSGQIRVNDVGLVEGDL